MANGAVYWVARTTVLVVGLRRRYGIHHVRYMLIISHTSYCGVYSWASRLGIETVESLRMDSN